MLHDVLGHTQLNTDKAGGLAHRVGPLAEVGNGRIRALAAFGHYL
jgi:hypothetical protein